MSTACFWTTCFEARGNVTGSVCRVKANECFRRAVLQCMVGANMVALVASADEAAAALAGRRLVSAEFLYQPRPTEPRSRAVFDYALRSRLAALSRMEHSAALLVVRDAAALASVTPLLAEYPVFTVAAAVNPLPLADGGDTANVPDMAGWPEPEHWQRYAMTDRWARILFALDVGRQLSDEGALVMPSNDAVWGTGLLARLLELSHSLARNGVAAAVSPYTPWQHSPVPGVDIAPLIIAALNAAFNRDSAFRARVEAGEAQAFWGKMGLLPFAACEVVLRDAETRTWEDDLEIDRVLKVAGYGVGCLWVDQRALYHQALPVFDRGDLYRVFERTLHYSVNLPAAFPAGTSLLNQPLDPTNQLRRAISRRYDAAVRLSEAVIAECNAALADRLARTGLTWVDWGAYRYVARVGDPWVQVWKYRSILI